MRAVLLAIGIAAAWLSGLLGLGYFFLWPPQPKGQYVMRVFPHPSGHDEYLANVPADAGSRPVLLYEGLIAMPPETYTVGGTSPRHFVFRTSDGSNPAKTERLYYAVVPFPVHSAEQ